MGKKVILLVLFLFLLFPLVNAQPPFAEEGAFTEGFFVEFTPIEIHKVNQTLQINAHVFNISNGVELDNATVICTISLFNQSGHHLIDSVNMTFETVGNDWEFVIDGPNFTTLGNYAYLTDCQDSVNGLGGFVAVEFEMTGTAEILTEGRAIVIIGLLGLFAFLFVINIGGIALLPSKNDRDDEGKIIDINQLKHLRSVLFVFGWMLLIGMVFVGSNIAFAYLGSVLIANILFDIYKIMMILTLPMVVIWFLWIFVKIFQDRELKKIIERGVDQEQI